MHAVQALGSEVGHNRVRDVKRTRVARACWGRLTQSCAGTPRYGSPTVCPCGHPRAVSSAGLSSSLMRDTRSATRASTLFDVSQNGYEVWPGWWQALLSSTAPACTVRTAITTAATNSTAPRVCIFNQTP